MFQKSLSTKSGLMIVLTGLFLFTSCEEDELEGIVDDDNETVKEDHSLGKFNQVKVKDHADLHLHQSNEHRAKVKAEKDIIDDVGTEIKGNRLVIDIKKDDNEMINVDDVAVHVWASKINMAVIKGSGDVESPSGVLANRAKVHLKNSGDADITTKGKEKLTLNSDGSGDFDLVGDANKLIVNLKGSGDVKGAAFKAKRANLNTKSSGDIKVKVKECLKAATYGSGDIKFQGNPTIKHMDEDGSGDIEEVD